MKGNGGASYDTAWGGSKNQIQTELKSLENELFIVNLTEKVGNNIWYRGMLNGKQMWILSRFVEDISGDYIEQSTSRLGHINGGTSLIYDSPFDKTISKSSTNYKNSVYYIKKQATYKGQLFYLLSREPNATNGVIGWMKASEVSSHAHVGVDKKSKTFYVKGNGGAGYDTAWGGSKNFVYADLESIKDTEFKVNLTEKVGNNIWYRGLLNGKQTWIYSGFVQSSK